MVGLDYVAANLPPAYGSCEAAPREDSRKVVHGGAP